VERGSVRNEPGRPQSRLPRPRSPWNAASDPAVTRAGEPARLIAAGMAELGLAAAAARVEALAELARLVADWSLRIDLTAHRGAEAVARRLVLDALALARELPPGPDLVDVGAGAGFPGLPIAVLQPARQVTLVEARERRHHFQRAALRALGLPNVRLLHGRAEALPAEPHSAAIAQALARPERALRWMLPWCGEGGWLLLPGGETPPDPTRPEGISFVRTVAYRVPRGGPRRTLWVGRRRTDPVGLDAEHRVW